MIQEISTLEEFNQAILDTSEKSHNKKIVVVDFYATWCRPCMVFAKKYKKLSEDYGEYIHFVKINISDEGADKICDLYGITSLPTFMFFDVGCLESKYEQIIGPKEDKIINRLKYFEGQFGTDEEDF